MRGKTYPASPPSVESMSLWISGGSSRILYDPECSAEFVVSFKLNSTMSSSHFGLNIILSLSRTMNLIALPFLAVPRILIVPFLRPFDSGRALPFSPLPLPVPTVRFQC